MAVKRGKSQARRNTGSSESLPGWAWLVLGVVLTVVALLAAPRFLKSDGQDGFFRPSPNPDARPAVAAADPEDDGVVPEGPATAAARPAASSGATPGEREFDFYTLLPGQEVAMSDAELAASARAEAERDQRAAAARAAAGAADVPPAAATTAAAASTTPAAPIGAAPGTASVPRAPAPAPVAAATPTAPVASAAPEARYILQAGAFGASGDAEALKAKIAMLGLGARVESATINGKTLYRVRMGPYGTASELAEAKGKLGNGGLPAMAVRER